MKNRILMITAVFAVMVAMTGIAAAVTTPTTSTASEPITIDAGQTVTHTATLTLDPVISGDIKSLTVTDLPAGIDVTIDSNSGNSLTGSWTSPKTWTVTYTNNGAANGVYTATYEFGYLNDLSNPRKATMQFGIITVPEFATVAMPIAAVLGLVFFFQQRKKKEE